MKVSDAAEHPGVVQGLTPIVGIILMVLITLVIAAIIGTFIVA